MTDQNSEIPTRTGSFRAAVRAGTTVTEYARAGSGQPLLLLLTDAVEADSFAGRVLAGVADHFRVIAPAQIPTKEDFATWLADFLDGLGLIQTSIVTEDRFGVPVLGFALLEPSRVDRLIILSDTAPETENLDGSLAAPAQGARPLLIVRRDGALDAVVSKVIRFLDPA